MTKRKKMDKGISSKKILYKLSSSGINLLRKLGVYKYIYNTSLSFIDIFNRKKLIKFYSRFINKEDLVFDIGANIGSMVDIFLRLGARVIAVEPQSKCMAKLKKKYGNNKKVTLINKAISDIEGYATIMISDSHTISSMSKKWMNNLKSGDIFFGETSVFNWQKRREVKTLTLDKLIEEYGKPSFCKIDVEGYENKVIKGLSVPIKGISFEFTPTEEFILSAIDIVKHLSSMADYRFNYSIGETVNLALGKWVGAKVFNNILKNLPSKVFVCGDIYAITH